MAGAFLSSAVIRLVTEKVLATVIEQLPRATNAGAPVDDQSQRQIIANVLAVKRLEQGLEEVKSSVTGVDLRLEKLEHRLRWRTYLWIVITAIVVFGIGFGTAVAIQLLGVL